jgi:fibronectin type 3 domain-containing protein
VDANGFESVPSTPTAVAVTPPAAPTNVSASAADNKVTVSWTAVTGASSYNIYRSDSQTGTYTKIGTPTTTSYVDTVTAMGTYYYKVSTVSAGGLESALSTPITATVAGPPTNVSASAADAQVTVSWTAVTGAKSYNVYRSTSQTGTYTKVGAPTTTSYVDTVTAMGTYYYKASTVSTSDFESALSTPTAVAVTPPAVPTDVSASAADDQVTVSWAAVTGASSYNVYRSGSQAGTYTKVGASTSSSYTETVTAVGTYYYKASAVGASGFESAHSTTVTVTVLTMGIDVTDLSETLSWLSANAVNSTHYTLSLTRGETISAQTLSYSGMDVTVTLKGKGGEKIVSLSGNGSLFTIAGGVTLVLDDGVTLKGHSSNTESLVWVNSGGNLVLKDGAEISGNTTYSSSYSDYSYYGGGVYVDGGTFTMNGGAISGNTAAASAPVSAASAYGGGVYVSGGTFTMNGGAISGNTTSGHGGGVYVDSSGTFIMSGGEISGNTAAYSGVSVWGTFTMNGGTISDNTGGVDVWGTFTMSDGTISGNTASGGVVVAGSGTFTMSGGEISGNTATYSGCGVDVAGGTFTMSGGTISGNTARAATSVGGGGGGVYVAGNGTFTMGGGAISGNTAPHGGGVYVDNGTFTMSGGAISGNTAQYSYSSGGGVYVAGGTFSGTFTKQSGGVIYGSNGGSLRNSAANGPAVYVDLGSKKRNTTVGVGVTLDSRTSSGWE